MRRVLHAEAGFTLIEMLVALLVVSLGVVAMLGALGVGITSATIQRELTRNEGDLIDLAESVKGAAYVDCAEPDDYSAPTGAAETLSVAFWDGVVGGQLNFVDACPLDDADAPDDAGLQRIVVVVAGSEGISDGEMVILKRRS